MSEKIEQASSEIHKSLILSGFCMRCIGLSFLMPKNRSEYWKQKAMFMLSMTNICYHVFGDVIYFAVTLSNSPRFEDVVPLFHTFGYGVLSIAKVFVLWYKIDVFRHLLIELAEIWPMPPLDDEYQAIKGKSLGSLSLAHRSYTAINLIGVWFYNITPISIYLYQRYWSHEDASVGYVWKTWYPFDKHAPFGHVVVYILEMFTGQICVWIMVSTDLLFSGMASHIGLLLRLLQRRLECIGNVSQDDEDQYEEIKKNIKLHQRLIKYCNDLEDAFSFSNLVNVVLSSVNICCVVFVIVLIEPLMAVSNKLFLSSALLQIGMICWYGDQILHAVYTETTFHFTPPFLVCVVYITSWLAPLMWMYLTIRSNAEVAKAAYNSRWYVTNPKCRRALVFLITRAQKPIGFTSMNFMDMNLVTYTSILTRSYSYFALLYTMYSEN